MLTATLNTGGDNGGQRTTRTPQERLSPQAAIRRARQAGVMAAWTGSCGGTVDLSRLNGPRSGRLTATLARTLSLPGSPPWQLSTPAIRIALYSWALTRGTQFDIYRWVNLPDLASVWRHLALTDGVRCEWTKVLRAAGLLSQPSLPNVVDVTPL